MSVDNPFATADAWEVSTQQEWNPEKPWLPIGNHVCTIVEANDDTAKSSGNPKLVLLMDNVQGKTIGYESYHSNFLGKIVALFDAAGIPRPQEGEFDPEDNCRLSPGCRARLVGKSVGVVIRNEL